MARLKDPNEINPLPIKRSPPDDNFTEQGTQVSFAKKGVEAGTNTLEVDGDFEPDCYLGAGVNPVVLDEELHSIINGSGDLIDQIHLYQSATSAAAWKRETELEDYKAGTTIPVADIVDRLDKRIQNIIPGRPPLNVVSLGSGEARQEQRLVQTLIQQNSVGNINLYLLDSSQPMLTMGLLECQKVFASYYPRVKTLGMSQNFKELPRNKKFLRKLSRNDQVNLITVLGFTFANVTNESMFLRNTLGSFPSKTLLLIDIITPYAPSDNPEEIKKNDPQFAARRPYAERAERRWALPFIVHHPKVKEHTHIKFTSHLENRISNNLKGSYTIEIKAQIDGEQWTIQRFKRYDVKGLIHEFREDGWSFKASFPFYDSKSYVLLFQKD